MAFFYKLELSENDIKTIEFVGHRYGWSDSFPGYDVGMNEFAEHEVWEWKDAVDGDRAGNHAIFPMLDPCSALYDKLFDLYQSIE